MKRLLFTLAGGVILLLAVALPMSSAHADNSLVGYWKFDEGGGTIAHDETSNHNDGTLLGGVSFSSTTPTLGFSDPDSLFFDGSNGTSVDVPDSPSLEMSTAMTAMAWVYWDGTSGDNVVFDKSNMAGGDTPNYRLIINNGHLILWNGSSAASSDGTISPNTWTLVNFTITSNTTDFYINGTLSGTANIGLGATTHYDLLIGRDAIGRYFHGYIDEARLYNEALTPDEITDIAGGDEGAGTDVTPPVLSDIAVSSIASTSATITWGTDELASSEVSIGLTPSSLSDNGETDTSPRVTSHSVSLAGGNPCTTYAFTVSSTDGSSNTATSSAQTFTTTGCTADATPSAATSTSVTVSAAATSTLADGVNTLTVSTPANFTATSSTITIQIKGLDADTVLDSIGKPNSDLSSAASIVFDVTALIDDSTTLDSFDTPVTISYTYTADDISGLDPSSLTMYHYHDGAWLQLNDCNVNTDTDTITCTTPSFSTFAIFGTPSQSSSGNSSSSAGGGLPWCSGPSAPGWNVTLPGGRCGAPSMASSAYQFPRTLSLNMTGVDVQKLQEYLNAQGFVLARTGPGSPGQETQKFGALTYAALIKYQDAHAVQILLPLNLTAGTGYFGSSTLAFVNTN